MVVVAKLYPQIGGSFSEFRHQYAEAFVVRRHDRAIFGSLVNDLKIQPSRVAKEFRVCHVLLDFGLFDRGIDAQVSARERDHLEMMFVENLA